jgi:SAM-dependent methyltransferase
LNDCPLCGHDRTDRIFKRTWRARTWWLARCASCGLHFTQPPPSASDVRGFYEGDYHSELRDPGAAERLFGPKYRRYVDFVRPHLAPRSTTLDVGCATGLFPKMLREIGYQAEGIELNPLTAAWGRKTYRVPIREGTLDSLLAENGRFDLISMTDVLEHTVCPPHEVRTVHALLKPSGHFLVTFPDIGSLSSRYLRLLSRCLRREWLWDTCHIPQHTWEFTYSTAKRLFAENGFTIAAFQRTQDYSFEFSTGGVLSLPANIPALPLLRHHAGSQMEFLLRKLGTPIRDLG